MERLEIENTSEDGRRQQIERSVNQAVDLLV